MKKKVKPAFGPEEDSNFRRSTAQKVLLLEPAAGTYLPDVIREAIEIAKKKATNVVFFFNGTGIVVSPTDEVDAVYGRWTAQRKNP